MFGALGESPLGRYPLGVQLDDAKLAGLIDTRSGSYTTPADYLADLFAWGQGGTGNAVASNYHGGGGAAAGYSRLLLPRGSSLGWTSLGPRIGASPGSGGSVGGDTTITVNGVVMTAQGGRAGSTVAAGRALGSGFQINRYGGGTNEAGEFGGATTGADHSGGGAGGFRDLFLGRTGGDGSNGVGGSGAQVIPDIGGGGGANVDGLDYSTWSGAGHVLILLYRI